MVAPCSEVPSYSRLTPRECDVLECLVRGRSTAQVAADLFISPHTVRRHVQALLDKTGTHSRVELVAAAKAGFPGTVVQPAAQILGFIDDLGLPVSDEQRALLEQHFTCTHECPVHAKVV